MFEEKDICRNSGYGWHAIIDGVYVFSYLDTNIAALSRFYETAKRGKGKKKFVNKQFTNDDQIAIILNKDESEEDTFLFNKMQEWRAWAGIIAKEIVKILH